MSPEENKQIVRRWIDEGVNRGDLAGADRLFDPKVVAHTPEGDVHGIEQGPKASIRLFRGAFPDLHFAVEDLIAEGDRVAARFYAHGSHDGEFMGMPPTGRRVSFGGTYIQDYRRAHRRSLGIS